MECSGAAVAVEDGVNGAATARVCFDDDCDVIDVVVTSRSSATDVDWGASRPIEWRDDESVRLSIELFDAQGALLVSLEEERVMWDPASRSCTCASFAYRWDGEELSRQQ